MHQKSIVSISLGPSRSDYEFATEFLGHPLRVRRFGSDGNVRRALALLEQHKTEADVIGLGLLPGHVTVGAKRREDRAASRLEAAAAGVPVTTGARLRSFVDEWAIRHVQHTLGNYFTNARVLFLPGTAHYTVATTLAEFTKNLVFADPLVQLGIPKLLTSLRGLETWVRGTNPLRHWAATGPLAGTPAFRFAWNRHVLRKALQKATVVVAQPSDLDPFTLEELGGKIVVTSGVSDDAVQRFRRDGVHAVIDRTPQLVRDHAVGANVLDAAILACLERTPEDIAWEDYLEVISGEGAHPRVIWPSGAPQRKNRFAFVIHPLSREFFKTVKAVEVMTRATPKAFLGGLERVIAHSPPFVYSHVTGIRSPQGVEAEGWLITVGGTPRQLLAHSPEFTYRRLLAAAKMAERLGAQIMGLGAFTKVVGDAGVTVAKRASIPITTGNSYSASGALWAAHDAVKRMGLLSVRPDGVVRCRAMVVGATGSIGAACARLLAQAVEELWLVSPEVAKLLALRDSILTDTPGAKLHITTRPGEALGEMDVIVTATSAAGKKVLDIMKVKPGCVITDVARPLDLSAEDVAKRPDVLVIESGEIQLPGDVHMRNIGLPKGVAYACLAETIVLALEGRFENYTVGRHIEWAKVKEIYKLGLRHGMKLAAISGVNGVYSDADIEAIKERALAARAAPAGGGGAAVEKTAAGPL